MITRLEVEETETVQEHERANSIDIGRCGCGNGCGMVFIGMHNQAGDIIGAFQMHWTEIARFMSDLTEQAAEARREEEEACGRRN